MVSFAIRCFLIGCALAVVGWLAFLLLAFFFFSHPVLFLAVAVIAVIGGLVKSAKASSPG